MSRWIYYVEDEKNIRELVSMHCWQMDLRSNVFRRGRLFGRNCEKMSDRS